MRRRVEEAPATTKSGSPNYGLIEAYSDDCFEAPTRFYIVSPDHPKLGKWAQPSTLKYHQPPQANLVTTECPNEATFFAKAHNRPRLGRGCSPNARGKTVSAASSRSGARSRVRQRMEPVRAKRPVSPVPTVRAGSESPPPSSIRVRHEAPRIDTPISGRVRTYALYL